MCTFNFILSTGAEQAKMLVMGVFSVLIYVIVSYFRNNKSSDEEPFNPELTKEYLNLLKNDIGSPGETSRVLTKKYYSFIYENKKGIVEASNLVEIRVNTFEAIMNVKFPEKAKKNIIDNCYDNIPMLITLIYFFEDTIAKNFLFEKGYKKDVYRIIKEEHNKICPKELVEKRSFNDDLYQEVNEEFQKYFDVI